MKNVMFWANVTSYIERIVGGEYDMDHAIKAAALKYHVSEVEIRKYCDLGGSKSDS